MQFYQFTSVFVLALSSAANAQQLRLRGGGGNIVLATDADQVQQSKPPQPQREFNPMCIGIIGE